MRIGVMLCHFEQHEGGVKVYTKNLLPRLLAMAPQHQWVLIYSRRNLLGTFAAYRNVEEVAIRVPGTICWDQLAVPWVANRKRLDLIFNPKFTVPLLGRTRKIFVLHGSEWFVIPEHFPWFGCRFSRASFMLHARTADAIITVSNAVKRDVLAHTGIDPAKLVPIHNGFDPDRFRKIDV